VDLAVVLEVEASEVVRRQCCNLLGMLVVQSSHTFVMKCPVCFTSTPLPFGHFVLLLLLFLTTAVGLTPGGSTVHIYTLVAISRRYQRGVRSLIMSCCGAQSVLCCPLLCVHSTVSYCNVALSKVGKHAVIDVD
jgi:hypothetical protein